MTVITPDWVKDAIFYQIFPDRFAISPRLREQKPHHLEAWDAPPTTYGFKGGDLLGVVEQLDYLVELGINAIYFCPVFQSTANHRYHTHDYFQIDPILGGNNAFKTLLDAAHARGIRIILDGVFNHASRGFYQFNHTLENGKDSPYLDWFTFTKFPLHAYDDGHAGYAAWWNLKALPKFNTRNPQVREYIMRVGEYWIEQGIDGWRLDVPGEIDDDSFWREFRTRVKAKNPEAYLVGEVWQRADRWLQGDQFDAVMNYQFTRAALSYCIGAKHAAHNLLHESYGTIINADASMFAEMLEQIQSWYPSEITYAQMNLLDSHDTARFLSIAKGGTRALKLAWLAMMTYPGAPTIYYGDEIGMEGGKDPDCRRGMIWDRAQWNYDLLDTLKRYITLRKKVCALRRPGAYTRLYTHDMLYIFARQWQSETIIVALNAGDAPTKIDLFVGDILPEGTRLHQEWHDAARTVQQGTLHSVEIPARDGIVYLTK
ncbi:MAG TPA: glycoside hydrolase family 13 protein [Anaerolineae bacterium]|nr:glycoside hydrolase family 13 protein [Anaerolineae bacterium]